MGTGEAKLDRSKTTVEDSKNATERLLAESEQLQRQQSINKKNLDTPTSHGPENKATTTLLIPELELEGKQTEKDSDETKVTLKDGRVLYYDTDGTLVACEKDGKRWDLKYEGDVLKRYEGKNSYLEYQANGWNRCTAEGCKQIEGFKVRSEEGVEYVFTGRVTKADLADPGAAKFADLPEIAAASQRMIDLLRADDAEGAVKYFAQTLPTMDSEQIVQLERNFSAITGKSLLQEFEALKNEGKLSPSAAEVLSSFLKTGKEKRTSQESADLALKALGEPNGRIAVALFGGSLGGNSDGAIEARKLFEQMGGLDKIARANLGTTVNQELQDIIKWGSINPATLIRDAFGYTSFVTGLNENTIDEIVSKMTPEQRRDYIEGARLSKINGPYTAEQEKQISFYSTVHSALEDASARTENIISRQRQYDLQSQRKLMGWEDMIRNGGTKDLVAQITDCRGKPDEVVKTLRSMTKEQWERLKNDTEYRKLVQNAIDSNFNAPDQSWGYNMPGKNELSRMMAKNNYEDAMRVSADRFFDEMGIRRSPLSVAELCERGDSSFTKAIKTDANFRQRVINSITGQTQEGSVERALAMDSVNAIMEDRIGSKATQLKRAILKGVATEQSPLELAAYVKSTLKNSPELQQQLATNPQLSGELAEFLKRGLKGDTSAATQLLAGQGLTSAQIKNLASKQHTYVGVDSNGRDKVMTESIMSKEEAINGLSLLDERETQSGQSPLGSLDRLTNEEKKVADAVARQGKVQPEDSARLFVLSMNNSAQEKVRNTFNELDDVAKQNALAAYKQKYGGDLLNDAMSKLSDAGDRTEMQQALNLRARTSLGSLSRGLENKANAENVSSFGRALTEIIAGNSYTLADKTAVDGSVTVKELADRRDKLSPSERQRLDEALANIAKAAEDIRKGKKEAVDTLEKGVMIAGAILAIPATMGQSGVYFLAGSATLIGLSEAVLRKQIKGADYNNTDMVKDAAIIGSSILIDAAPAISGLITRAVTTDAKGLLRAGFKSEELREDLRETIKLASRDKEAAEVSLRSIAKKYAGEGKEEALYTRLQSDLSSSARQLKQANRERLTEKTPSPTQKVSTDTEFRPTDPRQNTVWGKGNAVKISGENGNFVVEGFERTTGNAIVRPAVPAKDTVAVQQFKVRTNELEQNGFTKVMPNMDMYIKDGVVYRGKQVQDEIVLSSSDLRLVSRDRLVPPNATTSVVERTSNKSDVWNTVPLSGEDQYKLLTYLKKTEKGGFNSLNLAESNEMAALLQRVQPGDTIVSSGIKDITLRSRENLLQGAYIQYSKNMPKPGDMRDIKNVIDNEPRQFPSLKEGAEKLPVWDKDDPPVEFLTKDARVYKLTNDTEMVMPQKLSEQLDEVRKLRQIAQSEPSDELGFFKRLNAKVKLALHPYRNHPLPEEMARMILETPNPNRVKSFYVQGTTYERDLYNMANKIQSNPRVPASAVIDDGLITLYPIGTQNGMKEGTIANIFFDTNHEWSHTAEKNLFFNAYKVARDVESLPVPKVAREYALENEHEDWAVMFGENFLTGDPRNLINMAEETPLRAIALTNALRQELAAGKNSSPHTAQLVERMKLVDQTAMPKAQKILQDMTRSGDPKLLDKAIEYVAAVQKANPATAALVADYEGLLKVMVTTNDPKTAAKLVPMLKPYLQNRPEIMEQIVDKSASLNLGRSDAILSLVESNQLRHRLYATEILLSKNFKPHVLASFFKTLTKGMSEADSARILDRILDHDSNNELRLLVEFCTQTDDLKLLKLSRQKLSQIALRAQQAK